MAKSKRRKAIMEPGCNKDMVESQEPIIWYDRGKISFKVPALVA
jgi:hypothetical protein